VLKIITFVFVNISHWIIICDIDISDNLEAVLLGIKPRTFAMFGALFHSIWCMFWVSDFNLIWNYLKKRDNEMCDIPIILSFMIYGTLLECSAIYNSKIPVVLWGAWIGYCWTDKCNWYVTKLFVSHVLFMYFTAQGHDIGMHEIKMYWQNLIASFVIFRRYLCLCFHSLPEDRTKTSICRHGQCCFNRRYLVVIQNLRV